MPSLFAVSLCLCSHPQLPLSSLSAFLTRQDVPIKSRSALALAVHAYPQPERQCTFVRAEAATDWCCLEPQHSCIACGARAYLVIGDVLVQTFPPANLGLTALAAARRRLSEDLCAVLDLRAGNAWVWRAARAVPWLCTIRCSLPGPTLLRRAWPQKPVRSANAARHQLTVRSSHRGGAYSKVPRMTGRRGPCCGALTWSAAQPWAPAGHRVSKVAGRCRARPWAQSNARVPRKGRAPGCSSSACPPSLRLSLFLARGSC